MERQKRQEERKTNRQKDRMTERKKDGKTKSRKDINFIKIERLRDKKKERR